MRGRTCRLWLVLLIPLAVPLGISEFEDFDRVCGRSRVRRYLYWVPLGSRVQETAISKIYREFVDGSPEFPSWVPDPWGVRVADVFICFLTLPKCNNGEWARCRAMAHVVQSAFAEFPFSGHAKREVLKTLFETIRRTEHLGAIVALNYAWAVRAAAATRGGAVVEERDLPRVREDGRVEF